MRFPQRRRQENSSGGQALAWGRPCPLPSPTAYPVSSPSGVWGGALADKRFGAIF